MGRIAFFELNVRPSHQQDGRQLIEEKDVDIAIINTSQYYGSDKEELSPTWSTIAKKLGAIPPVSKL
jgi:hypothetical protein